MNDQWWIDGCLVLKNFSLLGQLISCSQMDVAGNRKAVVIYVPFRLRKAFRKIHLRLVRELEKKFSGKVVFYCNVTWYEISWSLVFFSMFFLNIFVYHITLIWLLWVPGSTICINWRLLNDRMLSSLPQGGSCDHLRKALLFSDPEPVLWPPSMMPCWRMLCILQRLLANGSDIELMAQK